MKEINLQFREKKPQENEIKTKEIRGCCETVFSKITAKNYLKVWM